jgi:cell division protein FtsB
MSFDIYGNNLKRGHCEIHPHVAEEYPCSQCVMESQRREVAQSSQNEAWKLLDENTHLKAKIKELEDKYQTSCRSWRDVVQVKENRIIELKQVKTKKVKRGELYNTISGFAISINDCGLLHTEICELLGELVEQDKGGAE